MQAGFTVPAKKRVLSLLGGTFTGVLCVLVKGRAEWLQVCHLGNQQSQDLNPESGAAPSAIQPLKSEEARGVWGPFILQMRKRGLTHRAPWGIQPMMSPHGAGHISLSGHPWPSVAIDSLPAPATNTHTYLLVPCAVGEVLQKSEGLGWKAEMQSKHRSPGFDVPQTPTHACKRAQTSFCTCWLGIR